MSKKLTKQLLESRKEFLESPLCDDDFINDQLSMVNTALEWVDKQQDWISVEDRLPSVLKGEYFLTVVNGKVYQNEFCPELGFDTYVTHWKPLPQPPKTD